MSQCHKAIPLKFKHTTITNVAIYIGDQIRKVLYAKKKIDLRVLLFWIFAGIVRKMFILAISPMPP